MTGRIEDSVAEDVWRYTDDDGTRKLARIVIGRPRVDPDDPNGDWLCPLLIEGLTDGVISSHGVGAIDALANALSFVNSRFARFADVEPRADSSSSTTGE